MSGLSRDLAERIATIRFDTLPSDAIHAAQISLADALAVMLAATRLEPATIPFHQHALASGAGKSTLLGGGTSNPSMAAFANGALAHALDYEDTDDQTGIHPNAIIIPAGLALGEAEQASGQDVLCAIAVGCDMSCRLAEALASDPAQRGWYFPPMIATLGAVFGLARLARLTPEQCVDALGLAMTQFSLSDELKRSPKSSLRAVRDAFGARAAVDAVLLARSGVQSVAAPLEGQTGLFAQLTGSGPNLTAFESLGTQFHGSRVSIKTFPCCRGTHAYLEAALNLRSQGLKPEQIEKIIVDVIPPDDMLVFPLEDRQRPETMALAKFSIPYALALAFGQWRVDLEGFLDPSRQNDNLLALSAKVSVGAVQSQSQDQGPQMIVHLTSDEEVKVDLAPPTTHLAGTLQMKDLHSKFSDCYAHAGRAETLMSVQDAIAGLPSAQDLGPLSATLRT